MNKCEKCDHRGKDVLAGRWIFYCPKHKEIDWQMTYDNEISGQSDLIMDGELSDMMLENL